MSNNPPREPRHCKITATFDTPEDRPARILAWLAQHRTPCELAELRYCESLRFLTVRQLQDAMQSLVDMGLMVAKNERGWSRVKAHYGYTEHSPGMVTLYSLAPEKPGRKPKGGGHVEEL